MFAQMRYIGVVEHRKCVLAGIENNIGSSERHVASKSCDFTCVLRKGGNFVS